MVSNTFRMPLRPTSYMGIELSDGNPSFLFFSRNHWKLNPPFFVFLGPPGPPPVHHGRSPWPAKASEETEAPSRTSKGEVHPEIPSFSEGELVGSTQFPWSLRGACLVFEGL